MKVILTLTLSAILFGNSFSQKLPKKDSLNESDTKVVTIRSESGWHHSEGDAEHECDRELDNIESHTISEYESQGYEYTSGSLDGYEKTWDNSRDLVKVARRKTLYFDKDEKTESKQKGKILSWDEIEKFKTDKTKFNLSESEPEINVTEILRDRLKSKVPQSEIGTAQVQRQVSNGQWEWATVRYHAPLRLITFDNINIISSNLILDSIAVPVGLPYKDQIYIFPYANCGTSEQRHQTEVKYSITKGTTISFSKTITSSVEIKGELKFGPPGGAGLGGSIGGSFSRRVEIKNSKDIREETTEEVRQTYPFIFPPKQISKAQLQIQHFESRRGFRGAILLEGNITLTYGDGERKIVKKIPLSKYLNTDTLREVEVDGYYGNLEYKVFDIAISQRPCSE